MCEPCLAQADLLRLLVLEREGGVYLDTDVVFVHPLPGGSAASAVGIESGDGGEPGRSREPLTNDGNGGGRGDGGGSSGGGGGGGGGASWSDGAVLCNAVMAFEAGAPYPDPNPNPDPSSP